MMTSGRPASTGRWLHAITLWALVAVFGSELAPQASAQTIPTTVTLSVPAGTKFAEGEGNTTVTVTATLSAARSPATATVIDLSLGGTTKASDYTVAEGGLPDITISAGQTVGTANLTLNPVNDNFFEGDETITIGGTATGVTVNGVDVNFADNDEKPTFDLQMWYPDRLSQVSNHRILGACRNTGT